MKKNEFKIAKSLNPPPPPTGIAETPIVVTWVTFSPTNSSVVQYWLHGADPSTNTTAVGSSKTFVDNGPAKVVRYIHRVKIAATNIHQEYSKLECDLG